MDYSNIICIFEDMNVLKSISFFLLCLSSVVHAQISRGIATEITFNLQPAEGVYEVQNHRASLYSFCVGQTDGFTILYFPDEDSRRLEMQFRNVFQYAYDIQTVHLPEDPLDRSREAILRNLSNAVDSAREGDIILLYFSGHGILADNPYVLNEYYFLPSNAKYKDPGSSALGGQEIRKYIDRMVSKGALVLVFVDTCHAEALFPNEADIKGNGGVAYFGSSSINALTVENGYIRSTDFTETLVRLLEGNNVEGDLTVQSFAEALSSPKTGNVKPRLINAKDRVLLHSLKKKYEYHLRRDRYLDFISRGRKALIQNDYPRSYFEFSEAHDLERGLVARDWEDYSDDIKVLNNTVAEAVKKHEDDFSNSIWRTLSQIRENRSTFHLDRNIVDMKTLLSCSGMYFMEQKDYERAYGYFEKAFLQYGDLQRSPYHMAQIAEKHLPGKLSRKEIGHYYDIAQENGYTGEAFLAIRRQLMEQAAQGISHAQTILGRCYYKGDTLGFKRDSVLAVKWLRLACEKNEAVALLNMGFCYRDGFGVEEDKDKAQEYFEKAASQGSRRAEYQIAQEQYNSGDKKQQRIAYKTARKLADANYSWGHLLLGDCYYEGGVVKKDMARSQKHYLQAAELGNPFAQAFLGICYASGNRFPLNPSLAVKWAQRSVEQNDPTGKYLMGGLYELGIGVPQSDSLAFHYYQMAADNDFTEAFPKVSRYYISGIGVEQNAEKAEYWMKKAIKAYQTNAEDLANLYLKISILYNGTDEIFHKTHYPENNALIIDRDRAYGYLLKAQELGVSENFRAELYFQLALCYEMGWGTGKDTQKALAYYDLSSQYGSVEAINSTGVLYYYTDPDPGAPDGKKKALSYFREASEKGSLVATRNTGICLLELRDTLAAKPYLAEAANAGDYIAQDILGDYFYFGHLGETRNLDIAQDYYEKSLRQVNRKSVADKLGWIYCEKGNECYYAQDYQKAYHWFQKSIDVGYAPAWLNVGFMYDTGKGFPIDKEMAAQYYVEAYEHGCQDGQIIEDISYYYSVLFVKQYNKKAYDKAYVLAQKAADTGSTEHLYWLAYMLNNGIGVEKNPEKAQQYYIMAYPFRSEMPESIQKRMAHDYYNLFAYSNKAKDYKSALRWCEYAAEMGDKEAKKWLPIVRKK